MKIRKGDNVKITSGNDKGKTGRVLSVFLSEGRIVVEGVNIRKKHVRPRKAGQKGEVVRVPMSFVASRAMILCGKCGKSTRVGYRVNEARQKERVCKKCNGEI